MLSPTPRRLSSDVFLHFPTSVPHRRSTAKSLIHRQTSGLEIVWEVWSNAGPEIQVRTIELLEPSQFQRSSTSAPSGHGGCGIVGLSNDSSPVPLLLCPTTKPTPYVLLQRRHLDPHGSGFAWTLPHVASAVWHDLGLECTHGLPRHEHLDDVLNQETRTNQSKFQSRLQMIPLGSKKTILARVLVSFVSVGIRPTQRLSEVSLQQPVFVATQDHQVLEEALRTQVSIPNVNYYCAEQARSVAVRHDHHRQVFWRNLGQASKHRAVLAQVRPQLVNVLKIRVRQSHHPCLDRGPGILAPSPGPGALIPSPANNCAAEPEKSSTIITVVTLTNLRHYSGHARTPPRHVSP